MIECLGGCMTRVIEDRDFDVVRFFLNLQDRCFCLPFFATRVLDYGHFGEKDFHNELAEFVFST